MQERLDALEAALSSAPQEESDPDKEEAAPDTCDTAQGLGAVDVTGRADEEGASATDDSDASPRPGLLDPLPDDVVAPETDASAAPADAPMDAATAGGAAWGAAQEMALERAVEAALRSRGLGQRGVAVPAWFLSAQVVVGIAVVLFSGVANPGGGHSGSATAESSMGSPGEFDWWIPGPAGMQTIAMCPVCLDGCELSLRRRAVLKGAPLFDSGGQGSATTILMATTTRAFLPTAARTDSGINDPSARGHHEGKSVRLGDVLPDGSPAKRSSFDLRKR